MTEARISIASDRLSAEISPLGAELWSLKDAAGRELMTNADPAFWTGHAPLLFPVVGRLNGDCYRVGGQEYSLPQHGFARRSLFDVVEQGDAFAVFRLAANDLSRSVYPFEFALEMKFSLAGNILHMEAMVANHGDTDMPFSFGYHPAFAWPLPYGEPAGAHRISFAEEEPARICQIKAGMGLIDNVSRETPVQGRELVPTAEMFADDALIWDRLNSRSLRWGTESGPALDIDFPDTPYLGLWQKPGAAYLCIEPWAGMADPVGFDGEIWEKPGIMRLTPGARRRFRMDVRLAEN